MSLGIECICHCAAISKNLAFETEVGQPPEIAESAQQVLGVIARVQATVRGYVPEGGSLVNELIADRHILIQEEHP